MKPFDSVVSWAGLFPSQSTHYYCRVALADYRRAFVDDSNTPTRIFHYWLELYRSGLGVIFPARPSGSPFRSCLPFVDFCSFLVRVVWHGSLHILHDPITLASFPVRRLPNIEHLRML
jgi:hypothetical protein